MKYVKTFCIALLLTVVNNTVGLCQNTDPFVDDEYPVYGKVLEAAYSFLVFSPAQEQSSPFVLRLDSGWEYDGLKKFQKLKIFADDYLTHHYGKFIFETGEKNNRQAFLVNFFAGTVMPIKVQDNGYGPQDDEDMEFDEEFFIHYHADNDEMVPFARYGKSEMCYISLQDQKGNWIFIFLHDGILCY